MKSSLGLDDTHMAWIQDAYTLTFGGGMVIHSLPVVMVGMFFTGLGQGLGFGPITSFGVWQASSEDAGVASGVVNTTHQMGATVGIAALTALACVVPSLGYVMLAAALMFASFVLVVVATRPRVLEAAAGRDFSGDLQVVRSKIIVLFVYTCAGSVRFWLTPKVLPERC